MTTSKIIDLLNHKNNRNAPRNLKYVRTPNDKKPSSKLEVLRHVRACSYA